MPALRGGAGLWPFDSPLAPLARERAVVLAETYTSRLDPECPCCKRGGKKLD